MRSVALLTAVHRPELALKPNVFILSYFRMIEVFVDIEPSAMKSIDDYMALTVLYYIKGVVECSNKTISELGTLVDLYSALVEDQKSKKETDQDEPDSGMSQQHVTCDIEQFLSRKTVGIEDLP